VSDIDIAVVVSLKALDLKWPIREEADIAQYSRHFAFVPIATEMGCPCHFRLRHDGGGTSHSRLATERVPITSRRLAHCGRSIAGGWRLAHRDCDRLRHHRRAHAGCASNRAPDASEPPGSDPNGS
jgi:hypothetical protein